MNLMEAIKKGEALQPPPFSVNMPDNPEDYSIGTVQVLFRASSDFGILISSKPSL